MLEVCRPCRRRGAAAPAEAVAGIRARPGAERRLQRAVAARFGLPGDQPASVREADDTMLWIEAHSLLGSMPVGVIRDERPPFEITDPLLPVEAERLFLSRFWELTNQNTHRGLPRVPPRSPRTADGQTLHCDPATHSR
jgi:hypothetical protein